MLKKVVHLDLDNTLIYSKNKKQFEDGVCVERLNGEMYGYMTNYSAKALARLYKNDEFEIVPITTRTVEQYKRLHLLDFKYVLVENGAVLLVDGESDKDWYETSRRLVEKSQSSLSAVKTFLNYYSSEILNIHSVDDFFIYAKIKEDKEDLIKNIPEFFDLIYTKNITKWYFIPKAITKLEAIKRFRSIMSRDITISAGDNPNLDWCMCEDSDIFIKPTEGTIYSDEIFRYIEKEFVL